MNQRSLFIESGADASGLVAAAVIPKTIGTPEAGLSVLEPLVSRVIKPLEDYGQCSFEGCDRIEQQRGLCAALNHQGIDHV